MTQSSCKRDTKSESHVGMKLAPVRVFSCKHPLKGEKSSLISVKLLEKYVIIIYALGSVHEKFGV